MFDLSDVIYDPSWFQVLAIDYASGAYDDGGRWIETYVRGAIDAAAHPATVSDMQLLAEGERELPGIKVYSVQAVHYRDLIFWGGDTWRVVSLGRYSDYGFFDCTAVRHLDSTSPTGDRVVAL